MDSLSPKSCRIFLLDHPVARAWLMLWNHVPRRGLRIGMRSNDHYVIRRVKMHDSQILSFSGIWGARLKKNSQIATSCSMSLCKHDLCNWWSLMRFLRHSLSWNCHFKSTFGLHLSTLEHQEKSGQIKSDESKMKSSIGGAEITSHSGYKINSKLSDLMQCIDAFSVQIHFAPKIFIMWCAYYKDFMNLHAQNAIIAYADAKKRRRIVTVAMLSRSVNTCLCHLLKGLTHPKPTRFHYAIPSQYVTVTDYDSSSVLMIHDVAIETSDHRFILSILTDRSDRSVC